jgi:hypothetical protein
VQFHPPITHPGIHRRRGQRRTEPATQLELPCFGSGRRHYPSRFRLHFAVSARLQKGVDLAVLEGPSAALSIEGGLSTTCAKERKSRNEHDMVAHHAVSLYVICRDGHKDTFAGSAEPRTGASSQRCLAARVPRTAARGAVAGVALGDGVG